MPPLTLTIRLIYAACLLGATYNHATILLTHGLAYTYGGFPHLSALFWTSLTVLDPIAAATLFIKPRTGLTLTAAIIITDVAHNIWLATRLPPPGTPPLTFSTLLLTEQIAFLIFTAATFRPAWPTKHPSPDPQPPPPLHPHQPNPPDTSPTAHTAETTNTATAPPHPPTHAAPD